MPTYGYECKSCGYTFDVFQSMKDEPLKTCPKCGKKVHRLIYGGTGIIFKGSGFYSTDKGGKAEKTGDAPNTPNTPKTAKTGAVESAPCAGCANSEVCPKAAGS